MITKGRCPGCGESVDVRLHPGKPGEIAPHPCGARTCQYEACRVFSPTKEMVELSPNEWYCPTHALLAFAREVVALVWLSRPRTRADAAAIVDFVAEKLPGLVEKLTEEERRRYASESRYGPQAPARRP